MSVPNEKSISSAGIKDEKIYDNNSERSQNFLITESYQSIPQYKNLNDKNYDSFELNTFKNDILELFRQSHLRTHKKMIDYYNTMKGKEEETEELIKKLNNNYSSILQNQATISAQFDKISQLESYANQVKDQMTSHEIRINNLRTDHNAATMKYDKIYLDNLELPGYIGQFSKYKNCKDFFDAVIREIGKLNNYKEKNILDFKQYKEKLETIIKTFNSLVENNNKSQIKYINEKSDKINKDCVDMINIINDRIEELRIENSKYAIELLTKSLDLSKNWEKICKIKEEIYKKFDQDILEFKITTNRTIDNFEDFQVEFMAIKKKFYELAEFIKDIRFRKNIGGNVSKNEVKVIAKKITSNKYGKAKVKEEEKFLKFYDSILKGEDKNENLNDSADIELNNEKIYSNLLGERIKLNSNSPKKKHKNKNKVKHGSPNSDVENKNKTNIKDYCFENNISNNKIFMRDTEKKRSQTIKEKDNNNIINIIDNSNKEKLNKKACIVEGDNMNEKNDLEGNDIKLNEKEINSNQLDDKNKDSNIMNTNTCSSRLTNREKMEKDNDNSKNNNEISRNNVELVNDIISGSLENSHEGNLNQYSKTKNSKILSKLYLTPLNISEKDPKDITDNLNNDNTNNNVTTNKHKKNKHFSLKIKLNDNHFNNSKNKNSYKNLYEKYDSNNNNRKISNTKSSMTPKVQSKITFNEFKTKKDNSKKILKTDENINIKKSKLNNKYKYKCHFSVNSSPINNKKEDEVSIISENNNIETNVNVSNIHNNYGRNSLTDHQASDLNFSYQFDSVSNAQSRQNSSLNLPKISHKNQLNSINNNTNKNIAKNSYKNKLNNSNNNLCNKNSYKNAYISNVNNKNAQVIKELASELEQSNNKLELVEGRFNNIKNSIEPKGLDFGCVEEHNKVKERHHLISVFKRKRSHSMEEKININNNMNVTETESNIESKRNGRNSKYIELNNKINAYKTYTDCRINEVFEQVQKMKNFIENGSNNNNDYDNNNNNNNNNNFNNYGINKNLISDNNSNGESINYSNRIKYNTLGNIINNNINYNNIAISPKNNGKIVNIEFGKISSSQTSNNEFKTKPKIHPNVVGTLAPINSNRNNNLINTISFNKNNKVNNNCDKIREIESNIKNGNIGNNMQFNNLLNNSINRKTDKNKTIDVRNLNYKSFSNLLDNNIIRENRDNKENNVNICNLNSFMNTNLNNNVFERKNKGRSSGKFNGYATTSNLMSKSFLHGNYNFLSKYDNVPSNTFIKLNAILTNEPIKQMLANSKRKDEDIDKDNPLLKGLE